MFDHLFWLSGSQFERLKSFLRDKVRGAPWVDPLHQRFDSSASQAPGPTAGRRGGTGISTMP